MNKLLGAIGLTIVLALAPATLAQQQVGDWIYIQNVDLITDENKSAIIAAASDYPEYARYAALIVRCADVSPFGVELYFSADRYLGIEDQYDVVYRIDRGTPSTGSWYASTDYEAAFAPYFEVPSVINELLDTSELIFRISGFSSDYTYVLPVAGLRDALGTLGCYSGTL